MNHSLLSETARAMTAFGKGLLASDDSASSNEKKFHAYGLEASPETRRTYRMALYSAPTAPEYLNGIILNEETFWQKTDEGQPIPEYIASRGIIPGVKVDGGLVDLYNFPGEKVTKGLDGLGERMEKFAAAGARFAKWRNVVKIGDGTPTDQAIESVAWQLAQYAAYCQAVDIVPIVEPEVMFDGTHTIEQCAEISTRVLKITFDTLRRYGIYLPGTVLKCAMVLPGKQSGIAMDHNQVADLTLRALHEAVPHELGGIVFLSGGQSPRQAALNLNRIIQRGPNPWGVTFSYLRSIQDPVFAYWGTHVGDVAGTHQVADEKYRQVAAAASGTLDESTVKDEALVGEGAAGEIRSY
jgi:fructose-bisphosphate aldolase class I